MSKTSMKKTYYRQVYILGKPYIAKNRHKFFWSDTQNSIKSTLSNSTIS